MEKRTVLVIVFSVVFILLYQKLVLERFVPKGPVKNRARVETVAGSEQTGPVNEVEHTGAAVAEAAVEGRGTEEPALEAPEGVDIPRQTVTLENDKIRVELDNRGGVVRSCVLKEFTDRDGSPMELINRESVRHGWLPMAMEEDREGHNGNWEVQELDGRVIFRNGSREKEFIIGNGYDLKVQIRGVVSGWISSGAGIDRAEREKGRYSSADEIAIYSGNKLERIKKKNLEKEVDVERAEWVAVEDKYFVRILDPAGSVGQPRTVVRNYQRDGKRYQLAEVLVPVPETGEIDLYMGPKKYDVLEAMGRGYEKIVNFGFFGVFAKWLFFALKAMNKLIGNYGWTIVVLTLLIRILLFPLNQAGLKSMKKMQTIQPKIKAIQEKYKKYGNDMAMKQKMNQEMQELYKAEGVNPLGGCLPMILQMPIFFAFWSLLLNAIELRQAPFLLWIRDLSMHDPYFVLPVLMGATQLISQVITPSTGDKSQKRMMYALPIVFTVVLAYAPSGLIVYWTTNNIAQIFQQVLINRATESA